MRQAVFDYIKRKYKVSPEYPWKKYDRNAVFRHGDNRKWFALVMKVQRDKLGLSGTEYVDVVNLKIDDMVARSFFPTLSLLSSRSTFPLSVVPFCFPIS